MFDLEFTRAVHWMGATAIAAVLCTTAAHAEPAREADYALPAQELAHSLREVSIRSGISVIAPSELVSGKQAPPLSGRYGARQAVDLLLESSGLRAKLVGDAIVISRADGPAAGASASAPQPDEAEIIVVTGSHVRGAPPTSPVITLTRRQIEQAAPASVEELMRRLPQNVSSGVAQENFAVTGAGADITDHGAGVNLRGLGQRATLVLVNGRRIAPSGTGSFVDVSLIPVSAIDRVEILTDGASAIYGSDAVGGVVNFILRDDFAGVEPMLQLGTTTRGGGRQLLTGLSAGGSWTGGRALLSYEYRDEQPIKAKDRDFTINLPDGWYLFPREKRHSLYGNARQEIASGLTLNLSGTYAARDTQRSFIDASLVPIDGQAKARSLGGTAALHLDFGGSWAAEASAEYYRTRTRERQVQGGALFNRFDTFNSFRELAIKADGPLVDLPAGPVKLALGAGTRREHFSSEFETRVNTPNPQSGSRTVNSLYGEIHLPLFSERNRRAGLEQLMLTAAGRLEHYEGIGSSFDPKVGLLWSPLSGLDFRASYGTSFRAPLLSETLGFYNAFLFPASLLYIDPSEAPAGVGAAIIGNNPAVEPETSKSFSAGVEWKPPQVQNLRLAATYYAIRFSNRIALPTNQIVVVGDPALEPIVTRSPDLGFVTSLLDGAGQVLDFSGPGFSNGNATPADIVVIVDARVSNTAESRTSGLDLALDYGFELGSNRFQLGLNANKVFKFDDRLTSASPVIATLNTPFHPVDWRARASLGWSRGPLSAFAFLNYTAGYRDNRAGRSEPVRSFTTVDAGIAYDAGKERGGLLKGFRIALNAQNLLDQDPPKLLPDPGSTRGVGYDPVNATGRGRTVSLQLRRSW
ncbi:MAG: TonB-dependent receptor [Pseudomonadota bacterium]|nr:TonB-dependent receptor [Pseudomonadota bacterium]